MNDSFWDRPDDNNDGYGGGEVFDDPIYTPPVQQPKQRQAQPVKQNPQTTVQDQLAQDFSIDDMLEQIGTTAEDDILNDAELRLEQAQLYQMILKTDLFGNVQANPNAVSNVQREIKAFILQRLELLLGMRTPTAAQYAPTQVILPFNDTEIQALKDIAFKLTSGKSAVGNQVPAQTIAQPTLPKVTGSIGSVGPVKKQQPSKPLSNKPTAPKVKNDQPTQTKEYNLDRLSERDVNEIAMAELKNDMKVKRPEDMSEQEKTARNKQITEKQKKLQAKPENPGIPIPTFEQTKMKYTQSTMSQLGSGNNVGMMNLINQFTNKG